MLSVTALVLRNESSKDNNSFSLTFHYSSRITSSLVLYYEEEEEDIFSCLYGCFCVSAHFMLKCYTPSIAAVALLIFSVLLWEVVVSLATDLNDLNASSSNFNDSDKS